MPSAISTSPMSSGSSHSTLHVEKTAAAPSISNSFLASLSISDPRLVSRESYWVGDTNIQVGKWPLWSGMGSSRMGLCEYFFDQVIHCSHGARWVYTLYHLPLNGNLDGSQTRKFLSHRSCCTTPLTPIPALTTELLLVSNPYPTNPAGLSA